MKGAHTALGSDARFLQLRAQGKFIQPIAEQGRLLLRGEAGFSQVSELSSLPASLRFFTGGDQSVRGYSYNSLAPRDSNGKIVGGEQLLVGSMEYERRIKGEWSAAVFYDRGNAIDHWTEKLKAGAGFGVRWKSPVGQVRVDLAWALSDPGRPFHFHLVIGPDL